MALKINKSPQDGQDSRGSEKNAQNDTHRFAANKNPAEAGFFVNPILT
jgi:hypothetical protein